MDSQDETTNQTIDLIRDGRDIFSNQYVILALTFAAFFYIEHLQQRAGWVLLNLTLTTIVLIIVYLKITGISFAIYKQGTQLADFWFKPAVVALGIPLYLWLDATERLWLSIVLSQLVDCLVGIASVVFAVQLCGVSDVIVLSMASRSVTTPIAIEVIQSFGGIPSLTVTMMVATGIIGALVDFKMSFYSHVNSPIAQGLSTGVTSHTVGASAAMAYSSKYRVFASLGIMLNGTFTTLFTPTILRLVGIIQGVSV